MDFLSDNSFAEMFPNEQSCINFLVRMGVFHSSVTCSLCGDDMKLLLTEKKKVFRCPRRRCGYPEVSYRFGSVFLGSMLKSRDIMCIARCWLKGETHRMAVLSTRLNSKTVSTWYAAFRELVSCNKESWAEAIGGPGKVVEVDETLLGHRKNNRGHFVEGAWTVVGIERGDQRRAFAVVVERRDAETIHTVIKANVRAGTSVYTDEWKSYIGIEQSCGVSHSTVKHKAFFKDPITGVCTNTVEGLNGALKRSIPAQFRNNRYAPSFVDQFIWKRKFKNCLCDAFIEMLAKSKLDNRF